MGIDIGSFHLSSKDLEEGGGLFTYYSIVLPFHKILDELCKIEDAALTIGVLSLFGKINQALGVANYDSNQMREVSGILKGMENARGGEETFEKLK